MTTIRTVLDLPGSGVRSHEATITLPGSTVGRWHKSYAALREGGQRGGKHSLGLHVYSRIWDDGVRELAVRWSNGLMKSNGTGFVGRIFFDSLSIEASDLLIVPDQRAGTFFDSASGVVYVARGGGHYFPPRGVLERRFLLVPKTMAPASIKKYRDFSLGFKGIRIANPGKPWGPAKERQPIVDEAHYGNLFRSGVNQAQVLLASGAAGSVRLGPSGTWAQLDRRFAAFGPWMPDGDPQAGAPAGYEIEISAPAWQQVAEGLELSSMAHECSMARNPVAWNDVDTGEQLSCHNWASSEAGRPVTSPRGLIMPAFLNAQRSDYPTMNAGSSPYQGQLDGYAIEDSEHSVRAADDAKFLAFTAGDPMAMDDLEMLFEHHRAMILNDRADARPKPHGSVSWQGYTSLTNDLAHLQAVPHKGTARGLRQWGWTLDLGVCCFDRNFCRSMVNAYLLGVDSCGVFFREWHPPYLPPGVLGAQMFHEMIDKAAALRACRMLDDPILTDRVLDTIRLWMTKVLLNPNCRDAKWVHRQRPDGTEIDPIGPQDHGPERMSEHILCVLGLAALCEIDKGDKARAKEFLDAGLTVDVPHVNITARYQWLKGLAFDRSQYSAYQAAIEALNAA